MGKKEFVNLHDKIKLKKCYTKNPARSAMFFMKPQMTRMYTEMFSIILHVEGCVA